MQIKIRFKTSAEFILYLRHHGDAPALLNPHNNLMKYVLLLSHFIDEKTNETVKKLGQAHSDSKARHWHLLKKVVIFNADEVAVKFEIIIHC